MMKSTIVGTSAYIEVPYNKDFVSQIKSIGGARWDSSRRMWKIPAACLDQARAIMRQVFGECDLPDESPRVNVKLTFTKDVCSDERSSISIFGKQIARAYGRDTGATVGDDVSFLDGKPTSGGSMKCWVTLIPSGSVAVLRNVPESMIGNDLPEGVTCEILPGEPSPNREALLAEKQRLLARIAEIDRLLS